MFVPDWISVELILHHFGRTYCRTGKHSANILFCCLLLLLCITDQNVNRIQDLLMEGDRIVDYGPPVLIPRVICTSTRSFNGISVVACRLV